jgi:sulfur transfer complex TusBCD TusB component (DsrH family)
MQSITDIYNRLKTKKSERKDIKSMYQDALRSNAKYQELVEKIDALKIEKKALENDIMARELDRAKLEELNIDIKTDTELLTDTALTLYVSGESVEIVDDMNVRFVPVFKVQFKKS